METKPFILVETVFKILGYEQAVPNVKEPPSLVRNFNVLGAVGVDNVRMAMNVTGQMLCRVVKGLADSKCKSQFDYFNLS